MPTLEIGEKVEALASGIVSCTIGMVGVGDLIKDWMPSRDWVLAFLFSSF